MYDYQVHLPWRSNTSLNVAKEVTPGTFYKCIVFDGCQIFTTWRNVYKRPKIVRVFVTKTYAIRLQIAFGTVSFMMSTHFIKRF